MGDFFGDLLFGSEGGFTEPPPTRTEAISTLTPEQKELMRFLQPLLQERAGAQPERTDLENLSLAAMEQFAMNLVGGQGGETFDTGQEALTNILTRGPTDFDQFFQQTVQEPALESFREDIIPGIQTAFAPQFFGGERVEREKRATEDLLDALTRARADLAFRTRQSDTENTLRALGLLPTVTAAEGDILSGLLQAGAGARESIDRERTARIRDALAFLGTPMRENVVVTGAFQPGQEGLISSAARTGAQAAAFFGGKALF